MATKECPYCHKEIADEAILCKFCHNLLIGGNQDIESAAIASRERAKKRNAMHASKAVDQALGRTTPAPRGNDDDLTKVFTAVNAADTEEETKAFTVPKQPAAPRPAPQPKHPEPQPVRQPGPQPQPVRQPGPQPADIYQDERYYADDNGYFDDGGYYGDGYYDDTYPKDEGYYEPSMHGGRDAADGARGYNDERYYEDDYYEDDEESNRKKKVFIITALITFSVIAVIALAIFVGYKLVGFAKNDSSSKSSPSKSSSITTATKITSSTTTTTTSATTTTKDSETTEDTQQTTEDTQDTPATTSDTNTETQPTSDTQSGSEPQSSSETQSQPTGDTQSQTQQTQQTPAIDQAQVLANVATALSAQNSSGIKSYEYRSEDDGAIYLYIFTNDNHAYSVAYFKASGQSKIVQAW